MWVWVGWGLWILGFGREEGKRKKKKKGKRGGRKVFIHGLLILFFDSIISLKLFPPFVSSFSFFSLSPVSSNAVT